MRQKTGQIIKVVVFIFVAVAGLIMLATCSSTGVGQVPDGAGQSASPEEGESEACSPENIEETLLEFHNLTREFDQVLFIAQNTPPSQLVSPLMKMQEIRHAAEMQEAPECMKVLRANRDNYMNATLIYMSHFMSSQEDTIQVEMAAAAQYQNDYKAELTRLLVEYELEPVSQAPTASAQQIEEQVDEQMAEQPLDTPPDEAGQAEVSQQESQPPAEAASGDVMAGNANEVSVLMRALPDSEAEVVGELEPFGLARVLGITDDGIWLLVECANTADGSAWLEHASVEVSGSLENVPLVTVEP